MNPGFSDIKFLIITALTIPYTPGGGRHAFSFARFLAKRSHDVSVLSLDPGGSLPRSGIVEGVRMIRKNVSRKNKAARAVSYLAMIPAVMRHTRKTDVVIIYGRYFVLQWLVIIAGKMLGKCIVFRSTLMGEDDFDSLLRGGKFSGWINRKIYSMVSVYFAITPGFSELYRKHYGTGKLFQSPQGVDTDYFFPLPQEERAALKKKHGIPDGRPVLLSVGSPLGRKGYLELFSILSGLAVPYLYLIAGETDVSLSPHLAQRTEEINDIIARGEEMLGARVRFTGMLDHLNEWLNIADVFLLNSEQEGLPNSLLECLASGTLALVRDTGDLKGYILEEGENAILYRDEAGFKKLITKLLENPESLPASENEYSRLVRKRISMDEVYREFSNFIIPRIRKKTR